jgi:hypothetical protein
MGVSVPGMGFSVAVFWAGAETASTQSIIRAKIPGTGKKNSLGRL